VYRQEHRRDGAFDSEVFPGIVEILEQLQLAGVPLAVATSKPESQAVRVLEHLKLAEFFTVICGATEDESRSTKSDIVAQALIGRGLSVVDLDQRTGSVRVPDLTTFDTVFICNSATPACPVTAIGATTFDPRPDLIERIRAAWAANPVEPI
jgi:hypothetical protein